MALPQVVGEVVGELLQELVAELRVGLETLHQAAVVDRQELAVGQGAHVTARDADWVLLLDVSSEQIAFPYMAREKRFS